MDIKNGKDLLDFLQTLTAEQLELPVLFDTEARQFEYHMALVGSVYCEDQMDELSHISLHKERG